MRRLLATVLLFIPVAVLPVARAEAQSFLVADEERAYQLVNATRAQRGLPSLVRSAALDDVARRQSVRMAEQDDLHHNPTLGLDLTALGLDWRWSGENVGVGPSVPTIHDAFVASHTHYENLVRTNYDQVGLGVIAGPTGSIWVTQVFAELGRAPTAPPATPPPLPPAPVTTTPAPATPPPAILAPEPSSAPPPEPPIAIIGGVVTPAPPFSPELTEAGSTLFSLLRDIFRDLLPS